MFTVKAAIITSRRGKITTGLQQAGRTFVRQAKHFRGRGQGFGGEGIDIGPIVRFLEELVLRRATLADFWTVRSQGLQEFASIFRFLDLGVCVDAHGNKNRSNGGRGRGRW